MGEHWQIVGVLTTSTQALDHWEEAVFRPTTGNGQQSCKQSLAQHPLGHITDEGEEPEEDVDGARREKESPSKRPNTRTSLTGS